MYHTQNLIELYYNRFLQQHTWYHLVWDHLWSTSPQWTNEWTWCIIHGALGPLSLPLRGLFLVGLLKLTFVFYSPIIFDMLTLIAWTFINFTWPHRWWLGLDRTLSKISYYSFNLKLFEVLSLSSVKLLYIRPSL